MTESLRDQLLALVGVAEVDVQGPDRSPSGVRVRLAPEADARRVGAEVQRILAAHGMRSRLTTSVTGVGTQEEADAGEAAGPEPAATAVEQPPPSESLPEPISEPPPAPSPARAKDRPGLSTVVVEEGRDGVAVTVTTSDGRSSTHWFGATQRGLYEAVLASVSALVGAHGTSLLTVEETRVDGVKVVTVVVRRPDGARAAGAAVVEFGQPLAVAKAAWAALSDRP
ncbi:MAG: hypothetical protein ACE5KX_03660 [Acidimicrobiia bacterium]